MAISPNAHYLGDEVNITIWQPEHEQYELEPGTIIRIFDGPQGQMVTCRLQDGLVADAPIGRVYKRR